MELIWRDENLVWDPAKYGHIYTITFPYTQIWHPKVRIANPDSSSLALDPDDPMDARAADWAAAHQRRTIHEWNKVLFTDESQFSVRFSGRRSYVWRAKNTCKTFLEGAFAPEMTSTSFIKVGPYWVNS